MNKEHWHVRRTLWLGMTGAFLFVGLFVCSYLIPCLPKPGRIILMGGIDLMAFFLAAGTATAVLRSYKKDEGPYKIWLFFAIGLWTWFAGELTWGIYYLTTPAVPFVTVTDLFWIIAYGSFSIALYYQYRLIRHPKKFWAVAVMTGVWLLVLLISHVGAYVSNGLSMVNGFFEHYLLFYYLACDLAIIATSLVFIRAFGTGILMRPWLGLMLMLLAEAFYTWLHNFNLYTYSADGGSLVSLFADVFYLCAFLSIALGCLAQYLLLKYGPRALPLRSIRLLSIRLASRGPRKGEAR